MIFTQIYSFLLFCQFKQEKKTRGSLSPDKREALKNVLMVTVLKMKYPASFNFRSSGDDEDTFNDTRIVCGSFIISV